MKQPMKIAVSGAAGQIGYALLFRIAAGNMLGPDQPVQLQLLEITPAMKALEGVIMELQDGAFPLLTGITASDSAQEAFADIDVAMLVGSRPRGPGMERKDLLEANGRIFTEQGKALDTAAKRDVKVLVVGNPANTNAYIAMKSAPGLDSSRFSAMTRLDHNRGLSQIALKTGKPVAGIRQFTIWGNHSSTQVPDLSQATSDGQAVAGLVDEAWVREQFVPTVQKRGAAVIEARGASSAASAASAAIDHMRDWHLGSRSGDWISMAIPSQGQYGVEEGLMYSFPVRVADGQVQVVEGLELPGHVREAMKASEAELAEERAAIAGMLG